MEDRTRSSRLLVVTDETGKILSALWPGVQSEGAPTETGISLSAGRTAHEVDIPDELYASARPDIAEYRIRVDDRGETSLEKAPADTA